MAAATLTAPAPAPVAVPVVVPVLPAPTTTCAACPVEIPAGDTWCSWICRNLDDDHDAWDDYEPETDD